MGFKSKPTITRTQPSFPICSRDHICRSCVNSALLLILIPDVLQDCVRPYLRRTRWVDIRESNLSVEINAFNLNVSRTNIQSTMRILCTHDRLFLHHSSVHSGILAGIAGSKDEGCYSVVLSGGYEDDRDEGYKFTYTGCGGRDRKDGEKPREGPQTCDQSWQNSRNQSLRVSSYTKKPVRVVRGYKSRSDFAPAEGYRYDGLYVVERAWMDVGKSGFQICKYSLSRLPDQPPIPRREGTLNLDLSQWEKPKHFGKDENDSDNDSPASSATPERGTSKKRKHKTVPLTHVGGVPLIRRPRDEDTDEEMWLGDSSDEDTPMAGPSSSRLESSARKLPPLKPPAPAPIPPTTNITPVERKPVVALPQSASQAPQPDVLALLAEWGGSAKPPPAQKMAPAQRPCPVRAPSTAQFSAKPEHSYTRLSFDNRTPHVQPQNQAMHRPATSSAGVPANGAVKPAKAEDTRTDMDIDWDDEMDL